MPPVKPQGPRADHSQGTTTHTATADAASANGRNLPLFQYCPPKVGRSDFGAVMVQHEVFHQIADLEVFYASIGYNKEARDSGLSDDEYIWDRYTRDGAKMSRHCLQVQIANYLHKHSANFVELYGQAYDELLGKCASKDINADDQFCVNCPMHPRFTADTL